MTDFNFDKILKSSFNFDLTIQESFFKNLKFLDEQVEQQFQLETKTITLKNKILSDSFILFCYLAIILYIFIHNYKLMFVYIGLVFFAFCLFLILVSYHKKSPWFNKAINHVMVFMLTIFLNFKVIYVSCNIMSTLDDHDSELIRTMVYDLISKNILCWIAIDSEISINVALYMINLISIIVAQYKSQINQFYYFDYIVGLIVTVFFYLLRRAWESKDRVIFSEKYRFEKYYTYTKNFIKGLNGYYVNISNDFSIYCDPRLMSHKILIDQTSLLRINSDKNIEMNNFNETNEINNSSTKNIRVEKNTASNQLDVRVLNLFKSNDENGSNKNLNCDEKNLGEHLKVLMQEAPSLNFKNIGVYKLESASGNKYFDVSFRKFCLTNDISRKENLINDLMMYDITELIISRKTILEESYIKQKIMAKLVHEFKTPINSIIGVIESIVESIKSKSKEDNFLMMKDLNTIRNLSNYTILLISDIIHFTNIKSLEHFTIRLNEVNLREIVRFGYDILRSLLKCNNAKYQAIEPIIEFEDGIDCLLLQADDVRLKQIILNFVSNAVKFTKGGSIKIKCSISSDREHVILSVKDTGVGIPDEEKNNLFKDFKMVKNQTIINPIGSGLGLSICKSLASNMGMQISTQSIYGKGSEFSIAIPIVMSCLFNESLIHKIQKPDYLDFYQENDSRIIKFNETPRSYQFEFDLKNEVVNQESTAFNENPLIKPNLNIANNMKLNSEDNTSPNINFHDLRPIRDSNRSSNYISLTPRVDVTPIIDLKKSGKILLVDDDHFINKGTKNLLRKILDKAGSDLEIISCSDGSEIIREVILDQSNGNQIKCILTDEAMEYINGSEAIKIVRNLEKLKKIKSVNIICVTVHEEPVFVDAIFKAGAQYVLKKPLAKFVIERILKELKIIN